MLKRQGGWAALLPLGLLAIVATGGAVMAIEGATDAQQPILASTVFGTQKAEREGKVRYEFEGVKLQGKEAPAPAEEER